MDKEVHILMGVGRAKGHIIRGGIQAQTGILKNVSASGNWAEGFGVRKGCAVKKTSAAEL